MGFTPEEVVYSVDFSKTHLAGLELSVRSMSTDELLQLTRLADVFEAGSTVSNAQRASLVDELLTSFAEKIESWNLETRAGEPLPPDRASLGAQDLGRFVIPVLRMAIDAIVDVDEELGKGSASGGPFQVGSLPMEALSGSPGN